MQDLTRNIDKPSAPIGGPEPAASTNGTSSALSETAATSTAEKPKPKDNWDKADILGKLLGSILIPTGLAVAGFLVNSAFQDRAAKQKTEEIALTVLQSKDTPLPALRTWATGVFTQMLVEAKNPLSSEAQKELQTAPLPASSDATLPATCPFDVTKLSGQELAYKFEGEKIDEKHFVDLEEAIKTQAGVPLSENQAQALASLAYNIGLPNVMRSSIIEFIRNHDIQKAGEAFVRWDMITGKQFASLHARRLCERDLFLAR
jgi:hypothetical protein